jgi:hypothetical protein
MGQGSVPDGGLRGHEAGLRSEWWATPAHPSLASFVLPAKLQVVGASQAGVGMWALSAVEAECARPAPAGACLAGSGLQALTHCLPSKKHTWMWSRLSAFRRCDVFHADNLLHIQVCFEDIACASL